MKRITFKLGNTIQVVRLGKTTNEKISLGVEQIIQTYTYSNAQFEYVKDSLVNGTKKNFKTFFSLSNVSFRLWLFQKFSIVICFSFSIIFAVSG